LNPGSRVPQTRALTKLGHVPLALSDRQILAHPERALSRGTGSGPADSPGPPVRILGAEDHAVKLEEQAERDGTATTSRPVAWSRPGDQAVADVDDPACGHDLTTGQLPEQLAENRPLAATPGVGDAPHRRSVRAGVATR
jgi:hypothetical protein